VACMLGGYRAFAAFTVARLYVKLINLHESWNQRVMNKYGGSNWGRMAALSFPAFKPLVMLALLATGIPAGANPEGPSVVSGQALMSNPSENVLQIVNTPGTVIDWNRFSVATGETTRFVQLNAASAVLNRVTESNSSSILGRLESNGRVFLVNPNGIVFGGSAVVDVAGLIASTLNISNENFSNGNYSFSGTGSGGITVRDGARILTAGTGGQVWLIANQVTAEVGSRLSAPQGQVILAAGDSVAVGTSQLGGMTFSVPADSGNTLDAMGEIIAERGAVGFFADKINVGGPVTARGGSVTLAATGDVIVRNGVSIDVSGNGDEDGGSISIEAGGKLQMEGTAELNADGGLDGGDGGVIDLKAYDLRLPVAGLEQGMSLVHALASKSPAEHGTVTMEQTGNFSYSGSDGNVVMSIYPPRIYNSYLTVPGMDGGFAAIFHSYDPNVGSQEYKIEIFSAEGDSRGTAQSFGSSTRQLIAVKGLADGGYYLTLFDPASGTYVQRLNQNGTANGTEVQISTDVNSYSYTIPLLSGGFLVPLPGTWDMDLYGNDAQRIRTIQLPEGTLPMPLARGFAAVTDPYQGSASTYSLQRYDAAGNTIGGVTSLDRSSIGLFPQGLGGLVTHQLDASGAFPVSDNYYPSISLLPGQRFVAYLRPSNNPQTSIRAFSIGDLDAIAPTFTLSNYTSYVFGLADGSLAVPGLIFGSGDGTSPVLVKILVSVRNASGTSIYTQDPIDSGMTQGLVAERNAAQVSFNLLHTNSLGYRGSALGNGGFVLALDKDQAQYQDARIETFSSKAYLRTYEKTALGSPSVVTSASGGVGLSADFATRPDQATRTEVPDATPPQAEAEGPPTVVTGSGSGASFGGVVGCNSAVCAQTVRGANQSIEAVRAAQAVAGSAGDSFDDIPERSRTSGVFDEQLAAEAVMQLAKAARREVPTTDQALGVAEMMRDNGELRRLVTGGPGFLDGTPEQRYEYVRGWVQREQNMQMMQTDTGNLVEDITIANIAANITDPAVFRAFVNEVVVPMFSGE